MLPSSPKLDVINTHPPRPTTYRYNGQYLDEYVRGTYSKYLYSNIFKDANIISWIYDHIYIY